MWDPDPKPVRRAICAASIAAFVGFSVILYDAWSGISNWSYLGLALVMVPALAAMMFHNAYYARKLQEMQRNADITKKRSCK